MQIVQNFSENYIYQDNLQSERLITRFLIEEDYKIISRFLSDKECSQFFPNPGLSNDDWAKFWVEKQHTRYKEKRFGLQALIHNETEEFIGMCGLLTQIADNITETEVGYHLLKNNWGKGYALEAAQLFKNYAFDNKLTDSVVSIIHVNNNRSQAVATKNGMYREKEILFWEAPHFVYRIIQ